MSKHGNQSILQEEINIIQKFLNEENEKPEEYDFKLEMKEYYGKYNKKDRHTDFIKKIKEKINNEENFVKRWFAYRTLEEEMNGKKYIMFDCDNSNDTCELTKSIYYYLWGWEKGKEARNYFGKLLILPKSDLPQGDSSEYDINIDFGGDTMNSLGTTLIKYINTVNGKQRKSVKDCENDLDSVSGEECLNNFAKYTSCIGNFVLVPAGFNGYRGIHPFIKDYWDLSLDYLAYKEKNAWLSTGKEPMVQEKARDNTAFVKYINMFFLWDYVDEEYEVRPLFASHKDKLGRKPLSQENLFPKIEEEKNEFQEFFNNVNMYIKRRGIFMAAMLEIAVEFKDDKAVKINIPKYQDNWGGWDVSVIYKYIVEKVFLADTTYRGYNQVFDAIEEAIKGITKEGRNIKNDILGILNNAKKQIKKVGKDANDKKRSD